MEYNEISFFYYCYIFLINAMAKIIFFEPGVVMGLWLGIVFAVFAIVVVNLKSFELSLKQYRFWRTMISQAVPL